jgi:ABC-type bacteriocin/lantibiotic exporter with double-glycine peptidase domain
LNRSELYQNPAVLVFDEAASSLDSATEADAIRAIEALQGEKTLIVIAHRLSTVRRCQRPVAGMAREVGEHAVE